MGYGAYNAWIFETMIKGYVGLLGQGKTLNMVYDLMQLMKRGRHVITNTPIKFHYKGRNYEAEHIGNGKAFTESLITRWNATFAIDEASVFLPSNFWSKLPPEYIMKFAQSRKYGVDFYYTTQGIGHTIKRLRDLTNMIAKCRRHRYLKLPFLPYIYEAEFYDPAFFRTSITTKKNARRFMIFKRKLYPSTYKGIFEAYNTKFVVQDSAMVKMRHVGQPAFEKAPVFGGFTKHEFGLEEADKNTAKG